MKDQMYKQFFWLIASLLILVFILAGGYIYKIKNIQGGVVIREDKNCSVNFKKCLIKIKQLGNISLTINPKPIKAMKVLKLTVETNIKSIVQISVDFVGLNMDMGPNSALFIMVKQGEYKADAKLSVCMSSKMLWHAIVSVKVGSVVYKVPFRFES